MHKICKKYDKYASKYDKYASWLLRPFRHGPSLYCRTDSNQAQDNNLINRFSISMASPDQPRDATFLMLGAWGSSSSLAAWVRVTVFRDAAGTRDSVTSHDCYWISMQVLVMPRHSPRLVTTRIYYYWACQHGEPRNRSRSPSQSRLRVWTQAINVTWRPSHWLISVASYAAGQCPGSVPAGPRTVIWRVTARSPGRGPGPARPRRHWVSGHASAAGNLPSSRDPRAGAAVNSMIIESSESQWVHWTRRPSVTGTEAAPADPTALTAWLDGRPAQRVVHAGSPESLGRYEI